MSPPPRPLHHQTLLEALQQFEQRLLHYAFSISRDHALSQDAVQDTFLRLARELPSLSPGDLGPWLFRVCRNRTIDLQRREHRTVPLEDSYQDQPDPAGTPDETARVRDESTRLLALVNRLPEAQREAVRLRYLGGLSYQEIARATGQTTGSVGWLLHEALQVLRRQCKSLLVP